MELVANSSEGGQSVDLVRPADRPENIPRKARSQITNGKRLLQGVDGRNPWIRRCKDIIAMHMSDLGGEDNTSAAERSIIRRASVLTVELERIEAKFAVAGEADPDELDIYARIAANLRRMLETVGIQRRAKPVPSLQDHLKYLVANPTPLPEAEDAGQDQ